MIVKLVDDGGEVFLNRRNVLYVAAIPADDDNPTMTLVQLVSGDGLVTATSFDAIVAWMSQDGLV